MDLNGNVTNIYNLLHYSLAFNGNEIYYISLSDMSLRYTEDYGETSLKLADSVIGFCIFEDKLIYEKSGTNEIFISDLDGNNYRKIGNGSYPTVVNDRLLCVYDNQIVSLNVQ